MALFGLTLKKLENIPEDIFHAIGGGGAAKPAPAAPQNSGLYQSPASQAAAAVKSPSIAAAQAANPFANSPSNNTGPSNKVVNFFKNDVVKPVVQPFVGTAKAVAAVPAAIGREVHNKPINDIQQRAFGTTNPAQIAEKILGNTAGVGLTLAAPGIDSAVENAASKVLAPTAAKVVGTAVPAAGFNAASTAGQGGNAKQIAESAAIGGALGGAARLVAPAVKLAADSIGSRVPAIPETPAEAITPQTASITPEVPPTPKPSISGELNIRPAKTASTGVPEIDQAIHDVAQVYSAPHDYTGNVDAVSEQAAGAERDANRVSTKLGNALKKNLTPEENQAAEDYLDGHPTTNLTPKALKVANALKPLREQAFDVRSGIKSDTGQVVDYSPRIAVRNAAGVVKGVRNSVPQSISDRFNLDSGFSESRSNDKFIGSKQTLVGNPKELGLTDQGNGSFKDDAGKVYKRAHATKDELTQAGLGPYERNTGTVNRLYHSDTLGLKARAEAVNELAKNPNAHGVYTQKQIDDGVAPAGVRPIAGVKGLEDLYATDKDASRIQQKFGFNGKATPLPLRAYDAVTNAATQAIVLNPFFHGMNQLYQAGLAAGNLPGLRGLPGHGMTDVLDAFFHLNEDDMRAVLKAGAGGSDYGAGMENMLSKATGGATKLNSKAMAAIELRLRASLYKASIDKGMTSGEAAENINKFLGDTKHVNDTVRRATLFAHYFKTMAGAIKEQVSHPIEQRGSLANAAALAAVTAAVGFGYQKFTGNPNANVRLPGELGLVKQGVGSVEDLAKGDVPGGLSIATNRINPVLKEAGQQLFNKDLFTGQDVTASPGGRLGHLVNNTLAPAETAGRVTGGKRSLAEAATNQLGLNTPHAKGYQAAPSGNADFLNTKKSIVSKTGDPTGYRQQQSYFNNLDKLKASVKTSDQSTKDALNSFLDRSHDPVTGQAIKNSPADSLRNAITLATNPKLLSDVQKFEKSQASHDPMWDLPSDKLTMLMTYKAQLEGSAERSNLLSKAQNGSDNWITDVQNKENTYYDNLPKAPGGKPSENNPQTPTYPVFDDQTTKLMATYNAANTAQKTVLEQQYGGELSSAFNKIATWTNQMRVAQTGKDTPQIRSYPQADAATQAIINTYDALPKGSARSAWITANPDAYAKMQSYLTQTSLNSLISNAAKAQFAGTEPDQQLLKDIKNVGQYDIDTKANPDGTTQYALNGTAAVTPGFTSPSSSSSSSSSFAASDKARTQAKDEARTAKILANDARYRTVNSKVRANKVSLKKLPTTGKASFAKAKGVPKARIVSGKPILNKKPAGLNKKVALKKAP